MNRWNRPLPLGAALAVFAGMSAPAEAPPKEHITVAFTAAMFAEVDKDDAIATMRVWVSSVLERRGTQAEMDIQILDTVEAMQAGLRSGAIDIIGLSAPEYTVLSAEGLLGDLFFPAYDGRQILDHYLVLVRRDSAYTRLEDLQGKQLTVIGNIRACLVTPWLDTLLQERGLDKAYSFFAEIKPQIKTSRVVLPTFFSQDDACVVTEDGLELMAELNPQVGQQLRVLERSPPLITSLLATRQGFDRPIKHEITEGLLQLGDDAKGQQVLMMFRISSIVEGDAELMETGKDLLQRHQADVLARQGGNGA